MRGHSVVERVACPELRLTRESLNHLGKISSDDRDVAVLTVGLLHGGRKSFYYSSLCNSRNVAPSILNPWLPYVKAKGPRGK